MKIHWVGPGTILTNGWLSGMSPPWTLPSGWDTLGHGNLERSVNFFDVKFGTWSVTFIIIIIFITCIIIILFITSIIIYKYYHYHLLQVSLYIIIIITIIFITSIIIIVITIVVEYCGYVANIKLYPRSGWLPEQKPTDSPSINLIIIVGK